MELSVNNNIQNISKIYNSPFTYNYLNPNNIGLEEKKSFVSFSEKSSFNSQEEDSIYKKNISQKEISSHLFQIRNEDILVNTYLQELELKMEEFNKEILKNINLAQQKVKDFDIEKPFEINNKNYEEYLNTTITEQLDSLIESFKNSIQLRSELTDLISKRNNIVKAESTGVEVASSLKISYENRISEITKEIGSLTGASKNEDFYKISNQSELFNKVEQLNNSIKEGYVNLLNSMFKQEIEPTKTVESINANFQSLKENILSGTMSTHNLLESILQNRVIFQ